MFGAIRRHREEMGADERTLLGRDLSAVLSGLPGFVACVVLEEPGGGCVSIELFEDQSGLLAAERLLARESFAAGATTISMGEVIFQTGL